MGRLGCFIVTVRVAFTLQILFSYIAPLSKICNICLMPKFFRIKKWLLHLRKNVGMPLKSEQVSERYAERLIYSMLGSF